ncbi:Activator of Hsp90 ATPase -like protein [uncultured archaeon]|nr:Activator of Hsp90 ATPase -like protein [uncultured archaeon]
MDKVQFVYETYILTTPEMLWIALIDPKITAKYWERENVSDWHPGSRWEHRNLDKEHRVDLVGKVVEFSLPSRLVLTLAFPADEASEDKHTRVTFSIEPIRGVVHLTVIHDRLEPGSEMLQGITDGWPKVLSRFKSLMETGRPLPTLW